MMMIMHNCHHLGHLDQEEPPPTPGARASSSPSSLKHTGDGALPWTLVTLIFIIYAALVHFLVQCVWKYILARRSLAALHKSDTWYCRQAATLHKIPALNAPCRWNLPMCRSTSSDAVIVKLTSVHPQKGQCRRLKKNGRHSSSNCPVLFGIAWYCLFLDRLQSPRTKYHLLDRILCSVLIHNLVGIIQSILKM